MSASVFDGALFVRVKNGVFVSKVVSNQLDKCEPVGGNVYCIQSILDSRRAAEQYYKLLQTLQS